MANKKLLWDHLAVSDQDGTIYMEDERMILMSASAFGALRKELIENIGMDRMKGFLIRYGWELGVSDAKKALNLNLPTVEETIARGPIQHMIKGHTKVQTTLLNVANNTDNTTKTIHMEGIWLHSYEAVEHVSRFGLADAPVCHTLIGYASGYLSAIFNHTVIVKEMTCEGMGHGQCRWVGKSLELWGSEVDDLVQYFDDTPIVKELEMTYEKLLEERNNLSRTSTIHKKLTEEIINGNDLQSIADVVYETTGIPLIIDDVNFHTFAYAGLSAERFSEVKTDFQAYREKLRKPLYKTGEKAFSAHALTSKITSGTHSRLITPILIRKKIYGYCSFVYTGSVETCPEFDLIILERIAAVCSLFLLNEKTSFEAAERMKGHFLEQVLQGQFVSKKEIIKRGSYINLDLDQPFYIVIVKFQLSSGRMENELFFHEEVMEMTRQYFREKESYVLIGQRGTNVVLLVQTGALGAVQVADFCRGYLDHLRTVFKQGGFYAGVSSEGLHIDRASDYFEEATVALRMTNANANQVVLFESLGVVGLLINSKNESAIKKIAQQLLGPLARVNCDKNAELLKTLYVFLENGGNLEQTANDLSLSMSGLRYRIQKIEALLGQDLRNPAVHYQLFLTLQALLVTGEITI